MALRLALGTRRDTAPPPRRPLIGGACALAALASIAGGPACDCVGGVDDGDGPPDPSGFGLDERPPNPTCVVRDRPAVGGAIDVEQPWPELSLRSPLLMLEEPGAARMVAIQRGGLVVRWDKADAAVTTPEVFADLTDRVETSDSGNDERGLLGAAFHPDWPTVPEMFLAYTGLDGDGALADRVSRFTLGVDGLLDPTSERVVIETSSFALNHNGGMIAFSPTDPCRTCLYYGTGDGGGAGDTQEQAQDTGALLGKLLRVDVAAEPYAVPADNPFVGVDGFAPEIWALGLRNPWRWSFDRASGDLWLGDVGQGELEEVDLVRAGGNYGWNVFEGTACFDDSDGDCGKGGFEEPIAEYAHEGGGRNTVVGGYVYRGAAMPAMVGTYLYADQRTGEVFALFFDQAGAAAPEVVADLIDSIASFAEDADGELYALDHLSGRVHRLVTAGAPPPDTFPALLSETGCDEEVMIPFSVSHVLWSDGADKRRFLAMPDDAQATILPDGDIDFPIGTVLRKDFFLGGEPIETRLLMRHDDGEWGGYSYEWVGDDARLVGPAGLTKEIGAQRWSYPSRNGCLVCHTAAARRVLGLELAQLNGAFSYPGAREANQLATLEHIGVFDAPLPAPVEELPSFPAVDDEDASAEDVARAYLHVNCAGCHRPGGSGVGNTDWRATVPLAEMELCDVAPTEGDYGVAGARRMVPGDPSLSLLSIRMRRLDAGRMPQLGTSVVDEAGVAAIDRWITSLTSCE